MTRDMIQGFIDGYNQAGGDLTQLATVIQNYCTKHPTYATSPAVALAVSNDLPSYRGSQTPVLIANPTVIQTPPVTATP